jgi:hypothetical protein
MQDLTAPLVDCKAETSNVTGWRQHTPGPGMYVSGIQAGDFFYSCSQLGMSTAVQMGHTPSVNPRGRGMESVHCTENPSVD